MDNHVGQKTLLGRIVRVTDAIGLAGEDVVFADDRLQFVYDLI
jgi:hypothetical protein